MEAKDTIARVRKQAFKEYQETHFLAKEPHFTTDGCQRYIDTVLFKAGIKEVVGWLRELAIHGGKTSLNEVLDIMAVHSPFKHKPS